MGSTIDGDGQKFMELEEKFKGAGCETAHDLAEKKLGAAVAAGQILEEDAEILRTDYPKPAPAKARTPNSTMGG